MIADILADPELSKDILCDIGMPVEYKGTLYNCKIYILNQEILLLRPKLFMADGDNYRENRYFKPWNMEDRQLYDFHLPKCVTDVTN